MMGRRVGGKRLIRTSTGRAENSMKLGKDNKDARRWLIISITCPRKRYIFVKSFIISIVISNKIKEEGRGLAATEGKLRERDVKLFPVTTW